MTELLARFVAAFKRGIEGEVGAMRDSSEAFEIALKNGEDLGALRYSFELTAATDRLVPGMVASLRTPRGDGSATVEHTDGARITITAMQPIDLGAAVALVIAPWFLYDRLLQALDRLGVDDRYAVSLALALFGKQPYARAITPLRCDHDALDASQRAAVQLCSDSELAFIWGPPGTGKTVTLTNVIEELLAQGKRILLASTTNAAIDQVLAKLATRAWFAPAVEAGTLIRLGRGDAETFGTELADIVDRRHDAHRASLGRLRSRVGEVDQLLRYCDSLVGELATAILPQRSLFAEPPRLRAAALARLLSPGLADVVAKLEPRDQKRVVELRKARLDRIRTLAKARIAAHVSADRGLEQRVVAEARVVTCTLTNAYLSPLMTDQRFDVLIAEEAGMASLPSLFYAACLCTERAIMVGDPRQLPPIVQSNDERVRRAIGRNIFDVAIADPAHSDIVAMLDVQYRMHPAIGTLVGTLFYGDRLHHGADRTETDAIAARAPFPGMPVAVVDTRSRTSCQRSAKGSSRVNPASAEITADLALDAVRAGAGSIAVITPYAAQAADIRRLLAARRIGDEVECSTIHRFQGRECDVVIIDLVDAAPMRPSALVADAPNLLNVSISRARGKLVIVADAEYFATTDPDGIVARMLRAAQSRGAPIDHDR